MNLLGCLDPAARATGAPAAPKLGTSQGAARPESACARGPVPGLPRKAFGGHCPQPSRYAEIPELGAYLVSGPQPREPRPRAGGLSHMPFAKSPWRLPESSGLHDRTRGVPRAADPNSGRACPSRCACGSPRGAGRSSSSRGHPSRCSRTGVRCLGARPDDLFAKKPWNLAKPKLRMTVSVGCNSYLLLPGTVPLGCH